MNRRRPLASRTSIQAVVALLKGEARVVVFPEGTYYRNGMGPGHAGLIRLIHSRIETRFIPVGIRYSPKGMRRRVDIRFGKILFWEPRLEPEEFLSVAMAQIAILSGL